MGQIHTQMVPKQRQNLKGGLCGLTGYVLAESSQAAVFTSLSSSFPFGKRRMITSVYGGCVMRNK